MSAQFPEFVDSLIIDGTKVGWWPDRIAASLRGERIAPVHMDVAWTRKCQAACHFCFASTQASSDGGEITKDIACQFLTDAAEIGVQGISLISDGESTVVPWYADSVEHGAKEGLKMGAGSNGIALKRRVLERVLPHLSFLRFNFSAGEKKRYAEIMGVPQEIYDIVVQNIKDGMEIINRDGLGCTLNCQMVVHPDDKDQIIPFAKLAAELRPTYAVLKHCSEGDDNQLGVDYSRYDEMEDLLCEAEEIGRRAGIRITVKWNRIKTKLERGYSRCLAPPFQLQMSGNGLIAPCGLKFNSKFAALHIGNVTRERFRDIWASDRYLEVMNYLASDQFDPRGRCSKGCLQDPTNEFLFAYQEGRISLPTSSAPPHIEFI